MKDLDRQSLKFKQAKFVPVVDNHVAMASHVHACAEPCMRPLFPHSATHNGTHPTAIHGIYAYRNPFWNIIGEKYIILSS